MQLELKLDDKSEVDIKLDQMQLVINAMKLSQDKVRRGLFARHGDVSKCVLALLNRMEELELEVRRLKKYVNDNEHSEWLYKTGDSLFALASA
jgi:hypothetical protein